MLIIVGLGNPGKKYLNNRHNVGQIFVDYLVNQSSSLSINKLKLYKTNCYMNQSGKFIKNLISNFKLKISNLIVIHDDLDIPLGKFKIQMGTGPKLHNGLDSIEQSLGTKDFWRIRIGVDNRRQTGQMDGETYVLKNFLSQEKKIVIDTFPKILQQINLIDFQS